MGLDSPDVNSATQIFSVPSPKLGARSQPMHATSRELLGFNSLRSQFRRPTATLSLAEQSEAASSLLGDCEAFTLAWSYMGPVGFLRATKGPHLKEVSPS